MTPEDGRKWRERHYKVPEGLGPVRGPKFRALNEMEE